MKAENPNDDSKPDASANHRNAHGLQHEYRCSRDGEDCQTGARQSEKSRLRALDDPVGDTSKGVNRRGAHDDELDEQSQINWARGRLAEIG